MKNKIIDFLKKINSQVKILEIKNSDIIFEERVKLKCFHCEHFNHKHTCPPAFPELDYQHMITKEYNNAMILYIKMPVNKEHFEEIRSKSTNVLHKVLLEAEKFLYDNNHSLAISFLGGSCKLCKNGCNPEKCNNPLCARIPMEALGINVIKTMKNSGIDIKFPITNEISRYGLLLWED